MLHLFLAAVLVPFFFLLAVFFFARLFVARLLFTLLSLLNLLLLFALARLHGNELCVAQPLAQTGLKLIYSECRLVACFSMRCCGPGCSTGRPLPG